MYKQISSNCSPRKHFFYKLYVFERFMLQTEQFTTEIITLLND